MRLVKELTKVDGISERVDRRLHTKNCNMASIMYSIPQWTRCSSLQVESELIGEDSNVHQDAREMHKSKAPAAQLAAR